MQASCFVRLTEGGPLVHGALSTDSPESTPVVVLSDGQTFGPSDVEAVYVPGNCPVELVDAAIQAGYYVLGQPRGRSELTYAVIRQTIDGERSIVAAGLSQTEAEELADHHTAGPDGMAVGCRFATYTAAIETVAGAYVQIDRSDIGNGWRAIDADHPANILEELACWITEDRPEPGDEYTASNGLRYRLKPAGEPTRETESTDREGSRNNE